MSKICCVDDSDICPNSPSCSMVLRSACSHPRYSRESSTVREKSRTKQHKKSKHKIVTSAEELVTGESLSFKSALRSSLKQLALNSAKSTYSLLRNRIYNTYEVTQNVSQRLVFTNSASNANFSHLSASSNTIVNSNNNGECIDFNSSLAESDKSSDSFKTDMSRTRSSRRVASARTQSDSEDDEIKVDRIIRHISDVNSNSSVTSRTSIGRLDGGNYSQNSSTASNYNHTTLMDLSTTQSSFERFRWRTWSYIYLKLIQLMNFDVWLLSKSCSIGKLRILLPLLGALFLIFGLSHFFPQDSSFSSLQESWSHLFLQKEEDSCHLTAVYNKLDLYSYLPSMSWLSSLTSGLVGFFALNKESSSEDVIKESYNQRSGAADFNEEQIRSFMNHVMDEMSSLKKLHQSENEKFQNFEVGKESLQQSINNLKAEIQSLSDKFEKLEKDASNQDKAKIMITEHVTTLSKDYSDNFASLNLQLKNLEAKLGILDKLKNCCENQLTVKDMVSFFEKNIASVFKNIVDGDSNPKSQMYFFNQWLASKFFTHEKLMEVVKEARETSSKSTDVDHDFVFRTVETTVEKYVNDIKKNLTYIGGSYSFDSDVFSVKKIVKEALMLYDADKTGLVDYALESAGGSILGTRCTETYAEKHGVYSLWGIPYWSASNSPRTAIQPGMQPGQCWAFKGSQGFLVIELSTVIYVTGFTMEHIPLSLSPTGSIDSAPKKFSVYGLDSEKDVQGLLLGEFVYNISGDPLQTFRLKEPSVTPYKFIQLQIDSNNGNLEYTCLYRFRVHGRRSL